MRVSGKADSGSTASAGSDSLQNKIQQGSPQGRHGLTQDTDGQTQLTSDLGILTEAPLGHKDSYVTMPTVPEVLHSKSNAPA